MSKQITIHDLAKKLNFSASTISRALNNHPSISQKTTELVQSFAKKQGYVPNSIAASLRNSKSQTIGVSVSNISRPFISTLISSIEDEARSMGFNVIISQNHDSLETEKENVRAMFNSRIGGLIASLSMETNELDHFEELKRNGIPVVFVDRVPISDNSENSIQIDNFQAGYDATKHLIDIGCRKIAHFGGAQHLNVYRDRKNGYIKALEDHQIAYDPLIAPELKTLGAEEGRLWAEKILRSPHRPDAIFAANDTSAVSAIIFAKEIGISIPDELAIIGFNDDPISSIVSPTLSTVSHPATELGRRAAILVKHLHNGKSNNTPKDNNDLLKTHLIIRESSQR